jgi:rhodanese-related sulfurtransferase
MKIKFISVEELLEMKENNEKFLLIDVLPAESYKSGHIPGAVNIPYDKLEKELPRQAKKTDVIVVYCASYSCHLSTRATEVIIGMGYKNVLDFKGGRKLWESLGLEFES